MAQDVLFFKPVECNEVDLYFVNVFLVKKNQLQKTQKYNLHTLVKKFISKSVESVREDYKSEIEENKLDLFLPILLKDGTIFGKQNLCSSCFLGYKLNHKNSMKMYHFYQDFMMANPQSVYLLSHTPQTTADKVQMVSTKSSPSSKSFASELYKIKNIEVPEITLFLCTQDEWNSISDPNNSSTSSSSSSPSTSLSSLHNTLISFCVKPDPVMEWWANWLHKNDVKKLERDSKLFKKVKQDFIIE